jgi:hypothetical protein
VDAEAFMQDLKLFGASNMLTASCCLHTPTVRGNVLFSRASGPYNYNYFLRDFGTRTFTGRLERRVYLVARRLSRHE